jgi:hypothetical protein
MTPSDDDVEAGFVTADEAKARECAERQEEMDAIAAFSARTEFPEIAASYVRTPVGQGERR